MKNLIASWKKIVMENNRYFKDAVSQLNNILGLNITSTCVNEMIKGKRNVPTVFIKYATRTVVLYKLKKEKYKMTEIDLDEFIKSISLPDRIK